jgi:hypothetical protein
MEMRVQDWMAAIRENSGAPNSDSAATLAVLQYQKIMREETEEDEPSYYSGNARRRIRQLERQRRGQRR